MSTRFSYPDHQNIETLNSSLRAARANARSVNPVTRLAAVLLLVNHVDYIASKLVHRLELYVHGVSYSHSNGTVFWPAKPRKQSRPLGDLIKQLNNFVFPDHENIIDLLQRFNRRRIVLVHDLLGGNGGPEGQVDPKKMDELLQVFDELMLRHNTACKVLKSTWPINEPPLPPQISEVEQFSQQEEPPPPASPEDVGT